jgi:hypothetical protein
MKEKEEERRNIFFFSLLKEGRDGRGCVLRVRDNEDMRK